MGESLTERHARSVGLALSGRAAAREAIRCGANVVLLSTVQYAPFVPLPPAVNYIVYGAHAPIQSSMAANNERQRD